MSLALAMGCTLAELGQRMTAAEFEMWCLYDQQVRPWGGKLDEALAGAVQATVANYAGKTRAAGSPPAVPSDFMPFAARAQADDEPEPDPVAFFQSLPFSDRRS